MPPGDDPVHHRTLQRQLRRLGLTADAPPDRTGWTGFLDRVNASYQEADADRYTLERSIEVSSDEMRTLHDILSRQARHDALTGLPNRAALLDLLRGALEHRGTGQQVAVLFLDLDGFKLVNDSLGHPAGDELLIRAAERIRAAIRDRDVLARLGGDEFVVVLDGIESITVATAAAERIAAQLERPIRINGTNAHISASVGIALATPSRTDRPSVDDLLRRADMAMYEAKANGRNRYAIFDDEIADRLDSMVSTVDALRGAVDRDELLLHYQPLIGLGDGKVLGLEALVRWERPGVGLLSAEAFVPAAEDGRLIAAIDAWVIEHACEEFVSSKYRETSLAVNLSARDLQRPFVVEAIAGALHRTGMRPDQLVIELTETGLEAQRASSTSQLRQVLDLGVQLAIDDFGTGSSSLSRLRSIPARMLKIDRSFIATVDVDAPTLAIVEAVIHMGRALGMTVVAEGVERPAQLDRLGRLGCDAVQGYLLARPQPLAQLSTDDLDRATAAAIATRD
jgi:diguanylate cyclase (GGDEF)-like protein